ncbi:hypothetical protein NJ7G_0670 [Natrinema sp. J7-2]|nr:hypothetical protein NJ7G_0670 [Natrinema sp. J7-2]
MGGLETAGGQDRIARWRNETCLERGSPARHRRRGGLLRESLREGWAAAGTSGGVRSLPIAGGRTSVAF